MLPGEQCIGGWAEVHDKRWGTPVRAEVAMEEYNSHRSLWKSKPLTMIRKVALVQALREAYPDRFAGTYDAAEMGARGEGQPPETPTAVTVPAREEQPAKPTDEEAARMREVCEAAEAVGIDLAEARKYVWKQYQESGMAAVEEWARTIPPQPEEPQGMPDEAVEADLYEGEVEF